MVVCFGVLIFVVGKFLGLVSFGTYGLGLGCVGVSVLYSYGGYYLLFVGIGLLLALFVVLELVRWVSFGAYKVRVVCISSRMVVVISKTVKYFLICPFCIEMIFEVVVLSKSIAIGPVFSNHIKSVSWVECF